MSVFLEGGSIEEFTDLEEQRPVANFSWIGTTLQNHLVDRKIRKFALLRHDFL